MNTTKGEMIENQLVARGINDPQVIRAMLEIDRSEFLPLDVKDQAYEDKPLPIGRGQTISQPYIVGYMAQQLTLKPGDTVLEIGTGCGYNAAVLSRIVSQVYSIEIIDWLAVMAEEHLARAGIRNVTTRFGDGFQGWEEFAPFEAITLTAAPKKIPSPLKQQLKIGGKLIAPVGGQLQTLILVKRTGNETFEEKTLSSVRFVPMVGQAGE